MIDPGRIMLFAASPLLLRLWIRSERIQPAHLRLLLDSIERLSVDGNEPSDVPVPGLNDLLGGLMVAIFLAQHILHRPMMLLLLQSEMNGAAHQSGWIQR